MGTLAEYHSFTSNRYMQELRPLRMENTESKWIPVIGSVVEGERGERECALMVYDVMADREIYGESVERESKQCAGGLYNRDNMYL